MCSTWVDSWPYLQTFDQAGKACQGQTLAYWNPVKLLPQYSFKTSVPGTMRQRHDTQHNGIEHNDTQHNDIQLNDTQHNGLICDSIKGLYVTLSIRAYIRSAYRCSECCYAECHYAECRGAITSTLIPNYRCTTIIPTMTLHITTLLITFINSTLQICFVIYCNK